MTPAGGESTEVDPDTIDRPAAAFTETSPTAGATTDEAVAEALQADVDGPDPDGHDAEPTVCRLPVWE